MSAVMHRTATLPDGKVIPTMHPRKNDPDGKIITIGYWDDDQGFVTVAQEVDGEYGDFLASAPTLYYMVCEQAAREHDRGGHQSGGFRECPMVVCERAARALLGADRQGPLV